MRITSLHPALARAAALLVISILTTAPASAQRKYDPGVSDTEIKIGNTSPYSGPASLYSAIAKVQTAYFQMINDKGGVNGRKIKFISYDDAMTPPKAVERVRQLVENDEVLFISNVIGTSSNLAVQNYLNTKKVPQLFSGIGASKFADPISFPWSFGFSPTYYSEAMVYAKYILENNPNAKIAILSQNDDYGRDFVKGLKDGLGAKAATMIAAESVYEYTDPMIESQILKLKASGADLLVNFAASRFALQAIKKMAEIGWKPVHILNSVSNSVGSVMKPAGFENCQGIITSGYLKDYTDPMWKDDEEMKTWSAFMDKYLPGGDKTDWSNIVGYVIAQGLVQVISQAGDELTRANIAKQAANLKNVKVALLLPGIVYNTSTTLHTPLSQLQMKRFKGKTWEQFGPTISSAGGR